MLGLVGVYGYVSAVLILSWALKGRLENPRKLVHLLTGGIVFFWWSFDTPEVMAGLAACPFVVLLLLASPRSPVRFLRDSPLGARTAEGHAYGLVMYASSWTIIAYFLFHDLFAASLAIAAMAFGDGMGEVVGRRYGRHEYIKNRSVEGTAAVFVSTMVAALVIEWFYFDLVGYANSTPPELALLFAAALAGFVSCLEAVTPGRIDNLVIPLVVGGYLHVLGV